MRRDSWRALLAAQTDVDRMVAVSFGDHPRRAPVEPADSTESTESSVTPFQTPTWNDPGVSEGAAGNGTGGAGGVATEESVAVSGQTRRSLGATRPRFSM